ncbi:MAG: histidine phosphatase family protein [Rhodoferax sp.]
MTRTLWLVRHAPVELPQGLCYGAMDVAARAPDTQAAAIALAATLPQGGGQSGRQGGGQGGAPGLVLRHSPLRRCAALAQALGALRPGLQFQPDARLREIDFGAWEGQPWSVLPRAELDQWSADFADYRPGGGENLRELLQRVRQALHDTQCALADSGATQAVWITHAGVMRAVQWLHNPVSIERLPTAQDWPQAALPFGQALAVALVD